LVGGFLLGVGFILSGLCPGTSVVSLASGRIDAAFALAGVFFGTFLFSLLIDVFPAVQQLYGGSSWGVSLLPALLGIPAPWMAAGIVVMAGLAFAGAEKVEERFQARAIPPVPESTSHAASPSSRTHSRPRAPWTLAPRWGLVGGLMVVAFMSGFVRPQASAQSEALEAPVMKRIRPQELAESLVSGQSTQLVLDLDPDAATRSGTIPGAVSGAEASSVLPLLPQAWSVIVFDADGELTTLPAAWPRHLDYRLLQGGFAAWERDVLTPRELAEAAPMERDAVLRQNALAAFFSGTQLEAAAPPPPPPPVPAGKAKDKKKPGGC
jgi:uncharacterized membrane protein YedE/YeeE